MPKPKSTSCGVKVSTWGTHPNAGNGMLHFLDTELFGGNVGHASVEVTFPADEKGQALIKKYCKNPKNPDEPLIPYEEVEVAVDTVKKGPDGKLIKEEGAAHTEKVFKVYFSWWPGERGHYLEESLLGEGEDEREGVHFEMDPKWKEYIKPEERKSKGRLGEQVITLAPASIIHTRDLSKEQRGDVQLYLKEKKFASLIQSLDILIARTTTDMENLDTILRRVVVPENKGDKVKIRKKEQILLNNYFPKWKTLVKNPDKLTRKEVKKIRVMIKQKREQIRSEDKKTPLGKTEKLILNNFFPNWQKYVKDPNKITEEEKRKLKSLAKKKREKAKAFIKEHEDDDIPPDLEKYLALGHPPDNTVSMPISNKSGFADKDIGIKGGLDVEGMLKKMQELTAKNADEFDLYRKNCSKTVGEILEGGAKDRPDLQGIFKNKAFGYFGNPQEVLNNSVKFQAAVIKGEQPSMLKSIRAFNPLERAGGWIIGTWMDNKASVGKVVGATLAAFVVGPLALAGFIVRKVVDPLESFRGLMGLGEFAMSKPSFVMKGVAAVIFYPLAAVFAIPAAIQAGIEKVFSTLSNLFALSPEKLKAKEAEIERENVDAMKPKQREAFQRENKERKILDQKVVEALKDKMIEIKTLDPKTALLEFEKLIKNHQEAIPYLSKEAEQRMLQYLDKKDTPATERERYQKLGAESLGRVKTLEAKVRVEEKAKLPLPKPSSKEQRKHKVLALGAAQALRVVPGGNAVGPDKPKAVAGNAVGQPVPSKPVVMLGGDGEDDDEPDNAEPDVADNNQLKEAAEVDVEPDNAVDEAEVDANDADANDADEEADVRPRRR
jgi:hypothetical protein